MQHHWTLSLQLASILILIITVTLPQHSHCAPPGGVTASNNGNHGNQSNDDDKRAAKSYLRRYGHVIGRATDDDVTDDDLNLALVSFQQFSGLPVTGLLDGPTKAQMAKSRCGLPDKVPGGQTHRTRRYVLGGSKWSTNRLTWYLWNGPAASLSYSQVASIVALAYKYWTDVACLFISNSATSSANLQLSFQSYSHGDGYPFDGPGQVLGHAFFPSGGQLHFDNTETWTNNTSLGINLLQVAVHEIGHQLGLGHSSVLSAVMYPYYSGFIPNFQLDPDDILGIRALYGLCPTTTTTVRTTTVKPTTTAKPTTTRRLTTTVKPTTTRRLTTTAKPTTTRRLTTTIKPTTTAKPTTTRRLTTTVKPTTTRRLTTTVKPTTTKPTTAVSTTKRVVCFEF